jgi:hypothetical protein
MIAPARAANAEIKAGFIPSSGKVLTCWSANSSKPNWIATALLRVLRDRRGNADAN